MQSKINISVCLLCGKFQIVFLLAEKLTYIFISIGNLVYLLDFKHIISVIFLDFPQHDIHSEGGLNQESSQSVFLCDFLYQVPSAASKLPSEKKVLEGIFLLLLCLVLSDKAIFYYQNNYV